MPLAYAELELYRHPLLLARLRRLRSRIHRRIAPVDAWVATSPEPVPFEQRGSLRPRAVGVGSSWGTAFTCAWFHLKGCIPDAERGGHVALIADVDGESLVRDPSGKVVGALSSRTTPVEQQGAVRGKTRLTLTDELAPDGNLDLWLDAGFNGKLMPPYGWAMIRRLELVAVDDAVEALYHDTLTCTYAATATLDAPTRDRYLAALRASERAWGKLRAVDVEWARQPLRELIDGDPDPALLVHAIGHGHLDLAWLWPIRETRRKAERTLTHQLELLEANPQLHYGLSQPQQITWLEQQAPELFERVRQAAQSGAIEPQGGMWVEADTNLPSGESLVRQIVHGQRYWESFGVPLPDICWLPDVFGYSGNLPQLLVKGGMGRFCTIKLSWNEHNEFPHRSFRWTGIDGSEVLVHMPPEGTYNSSATPAALRMLIDNYPELDAAPEALLVYGSGDGGGGPGQTHVEQVARLARATGFPEVRPATARQFFDALELRRDALPSFTGELYLEKHQGTYTTQAANKRWNRLLEHRLHDVEHLATKAWLDGGEWPAELLDETWREVLLYQFHDIIPGSSIARVYAESCERYAQLDADLRDEQGRLLEALPSGSPCLVNTTGHHRSGHVRHDGRWFAYDAPAGATVELSPPLESGAWIDEHGLGNEHLQVRFAADGTIDSFIDLASGRDHAGAGLNRLVIHRDPWRYFDAWDIHESYLTREPTVLIPERVECLTDGPLVIRRSTYRHGASTIQQDVVLAPGQRDLRFVTSVEWHETWRMLRAEFRPTAWADEVTCDIQFGHLSRSTRDDTPQEKAQFEICAHQWVDVSDEAGGLSLLNDCKYGHRVKSGLISLNLLRSPVYPDPRADRGSHRFTYALYAHEGPVVDSLTPELAADLNAPLVIASTEPAAAWVEVVGDGVLLDTVKRAEDGDGVVVRLHETRGRGAEVALKVAFAHSDASEVDLLERPLGPADLQHLEFGPFELRTFRLRRTE